MFLIKIIKTITIHKYILTFCQSHNKTANCLTKLNMQGYLEINSFATSFLITKTLVEIGWLECCKLIKVIMLVDRWQRCSFVRKFEKNK